MSLVRNFSPILANFFLLQLNARLDAAIPAGTGMAGFLRVAIQQMMLRDLNSELTRIPSVAIHSMHLLFKPLRVSGSF